MPLQTILEPVANWPGRYGSRGVHIPGLTNPAELPAVNLTTAASVWVWAGAATTTDPRALHKPDQSGRSARCYYKAGGFDIAITLAEPGVVTMYFLDWDGKNTRGQQVDVYRNGSLVDGGFKFREFSTGQFWRVEIAEPGDYVFRFTQIGAINCVVSGIFLDPPLGPPPDNISPAMVRGLITENGQGLAITTSEAVKYPEGETPLGFSLASTLDYPVSLEFADQSADRLTLNFRVVRERPISQGERVYLSGAASNVVDLAGNKLSEFSGIEIDNGSTVPGPVWEPVLTHTVQNAGGYRLRHLVERLKWPEVTGGE